MDGKNNIISFPNNSGLTIQSVKESNKGKINYVRLDMGDSLSKANNGLFINQNGQNPFLPQINQKDDVPQSIKLKSRSNPSTKNINVQKINLNNANTNAFNCNTITQSNTNRKKKIKFYNELNKMQLENICSPRESNNNKISNTTKVDFQCTKNVINKINFANCNFYFRN